MAIYPSYKVLPYVYKGIHKITGKIYIGSMTTKKQKLPSDQDFPKYKTSSKIVKPIFDEFDWYIVAEFFDPQDAYDFEQELIYEQWLVSKEMSLNRFHHHGKKSWNTLGIKIIFSEEHKLNMRKPKSKEHGKKVGDALRGKLFTEERKQNLRNLRPTSKGIPKSESHKQNIKESKRFEHSFLTPDGSIIENITIIELCSQFDLNYNSISRYFRENRTYKGFTLIKLENYI